MTFWRMAQVRETYYAAVYWGCRVETAEECARRAEMFFHRLSRCAPDYTRWFEQADSLKKALQLQFEPTTETFIRFFKKRSNRLGKVGFIFSTWTGHMEDERGGMVRFLCGSDALGASNSCLLQLPKEQPGQERVLTVPVLTEIMRAMVLAWAPDWGVVTSDDLRDSLSEKGYAGTFPGWLTYFSHSRGEVPALPAPARTEAVEDQGTLLILTPERLTASNPEHLALGRHIQDTLHTQGLLAPVVSRAPAS
ncbi:Imm52 family immunity protein [Archangium lansingense]|uniref:Imm52 family immunity protein n=1 Tax=Archangium lansingense TaxID=2995310 RepID=A0ABT3ZX13_9BACT|nr:Imm52 family immunity protein [Archangium lansinium]MCY1073934.1 Imm52 family immunity protein [Archangium lansinium]